MSKSKATGAARSGAAASIQAEPSQLVVEDFSSWPGENSLEEYSGAGALENGSGEGELVDGALRLEYDDEGWFLSNVRADRAEYTHLELDVRGADGGEEDDVFLEIDSVEARLSELTDDSIDTEFSTVRVDLADAGVDGSSVQDVWLTFWNAGSGALEIDELRFVDRSGEIISAGDYDTRDTTGDGLHNDFDGDERTTHDDVTAFFESIDSDGVQNNPDAFDFDGDGSLGFGDVVQLLRDV